MDDIIKYCNYFEIETTDVTYIFKPKHIPHTPTEYYIETNYYIIINSLGLIYRHNIKHNGMIIKNKYTEFGLDMPFPNNVSFDENLQQKLLNIMKQRKKEITKNCEKIYENNQYPNIMNENFKQNIVILQCYYIMYDVVYKFKFKKN
jgi:hypothetical protein